MNDDLVLDNLPLIHLVIKRLHLTWKTEDEFQAYYDAGVDGLIDGARTFDESKGYTQSTYLYTCIANRIKRVLYLNTMPKRCNPNGSDISIETKIGDEDGTTLGDFIVDPNINIEKDLEEKLEKERLIYALDKALNEREKRIICHMYGINGYQKTSLVQCGVLEGLSRERVNQIKKKSIDKLEKYLKRNDKEVFMIEPKVQTINQVEKEKKNTLTTLNEILFDQLAKLDDNNADFDKEIRKAYVKAQLAQQITNNTNTMLKAVKLANENKSNKSVLKMIGTDNG